MENNETVQPANAEPAPKAEDKPDYFNRLVTIVILLTTVWTAYLAYIQSYDGDRQGDAARDSQVASLVASNAFNSAIQQTSHDAKLLARYDELTLQSQAYDTTAADLRAAGDVFNGRLAADASARMLQARSVITPFSTIFTDTRWLGADSRPNLSLRDPELFEPAYRAEETQIILSQQSSAIAVKSNLYVLLIALAAVCLFLFGLSLTLSVPFVRMLFVAMGCLIVAGSVVWYAVARAAPEPTLTDEAIAAFARGRVLANQGRNDQAVQSFTTAIDKAGSPLGYARAYLQRGNASYAREDYTAALADYTQAIKLEPGPDVYSARGWAQVELKDYAEAVADFKQAVAMSPDSDDDLNSLGWALYRTGDYAGAIARYRAAISLNASLPLYHLNLGIAQLAAGDAAAAQAPYQAGLDLARGKPVDLVGWQLDSAVSDLESIGEAPGIKMTGDLSQTAQAWLAATRTRLGEIGGQIEEVTFSTGADGDQPADRRKVFEPGTTEVHVFVDFSGFVDGALWSDVWYVNDAKADALTSTRLPWENGEEGTSHFALTTDAEGLVPGEYKVEFMLGDRVLRADSFRVRPTNASFGDITFSEGVDDKGETKNPGYSFAKGPREIAAVFEYANMTPGLKWSALWWQGDAEIDTGMAAAPTWTLGENGMTYVTLSSQQPLEPGEYSLVLLVEGDVFQEGTFQIIEPSNAFSAVAFAAAVDAAGKPISSTDTFAAGTPAVYATFDYAGLKDGQAWSAAWYRDGQLASRSEGAWRAGASGSTWLLFSEKDGLAPGQYDLELSLDGKVAQIGSMVVEAP